MIFLLCILISAPLCLLVYCMYRSWPRQKDDSISIMSFVYSIRLGFLCIISALSLSVILLEVCLGEWFLFRVKHLGITLVLLSCYTFCIYICFGVSLLFLGYHLCVGFSSWRAYLWSNRQELFSELLLALVLSSLLGLLIFLQFKTHFVSLIEIHLLKNGKSTVDLLNVFLSDVLKPKEILPIVQTFVWDDSAGFGTHLKLLNNGSEGGTDTAPKKVAEIFVNPEIGGVASCSRTLEILEAVQEKVKEQLKVNTEDVSDSVRPIAEAYNGIVD